MKVTTIRRGRAADLRGRAVRAALLRKQNAVRTLTGEALDVLSDPKNVSTGGWEELGMTARWALFKAEVDELEQALFYGEGNAALECGDCNAFLASIHELVKTREVLR